MTLGPKAFRSRNRPPGAPSAMALRSMESPGAATNAFTTMWDGHGAAGSSLSIRNLPSRATSRRTFTATPVTLSVVTVTMVTPTTISRDVAECGVRTTSSRYVPGGTGFVTNAAVGPVPVIGDSRLLRKRQGIDPGPQGIGRADGTDDRVAPRQAGQLAEAEHRFDSSAVRAEQVADPDRLETACRPGQVVVGRGEQVETADGGFDRRLAND